MKTPDISTIHETVLHGDMRFHLMVHEFASDPSRSERVTSHWHEEYELLFLTEGNGTAHVNGRALPISAGDILFFNSGEVHSISAPPGVPLTFYAVVFGLDLISSYGNDDIQQKYIHRQTSGELLFQTVFHPKNPGTEPLRQSLEAIRSLYQEDFPPMSSSSRRNFSGSGTISAAIPRHKPSRFIPKMTQKSSSRKKSSGSFRNIIAPF